MNFRKCVALATLSTLVLLSSDLSSLAQTDKRGLKTRPGERVTHWPSSSKRWALIVGVDKYKDKQIGSLNGADNDAKSLADALIQHAGFRADQVILLATDQPEERQPTRVNIFRRLSNLKSLVPKDGLLLVAFAGHGIERNGKPFLLPSDAQFSDDVVFLEETALSVTRIMDYIRATAVQQVVLILDACRNDPAGRGDSANNLTETYTRAFNFDLRNSEVTAFATLYATGVGERAYEYSEKQQGYFTWAIVEGLKGAAANQQGEITLAGLLKYIQEKVPKQISIDLGAGKLQKPFAVIEGYKANELIIAMSASVPRPGDKSVTPPAPGAGRKAVVPTTHSEKGDEFFRHKKWVDAETEYRAAIKEEGDESTLRVRLGLALYHQNSFRKAEEEHKRAIALDPRNGKAHFSLGLALKAQSRFRDAEDAFRASLTITPGNSMAHFNLGVTLSGLSRYQEAEEEFRECLRLDPKFVTPHYELGRLLHNQRRYAEAEVHYTAALLLSPNDDFYHLSLGETLAAQGKYPQAEAEYKLALKLNPRNSKAQNGLDQLPKKKD
jgi:tetratricopeptide (TPR) repeat protein